MRTLLWLQNDFRLHDNPALFEAAESDQLLIMTCWPNPKPWCNLRGIGAQRHRFLAETLSVFQKNLVELGQGLHITAQSAATAIPELVKEHNIDRIVTTAPHAYEERILVEHVQKAIDIKLNLIRNNTLLNESQLPFELEDIPKHFTPFRKKVESLEIEAPLPKPLRLPPMIKGVRYNVMHPNTKLAPIRRCHFVVGNKKPCVESKTGYSTDALSSPTRKHATRSMDWITSLRFHLGWRLVPCLPDSLRLKLRDSSARSPRTNQLTGSFSNYFGANSFTGVRS